ncbi:hypothetical protein Vafri_7065 [Volvox africanus]|uniref:Uncharacterized protein n=1 Tax=Volvox africanus TaxID=51714 RepID=A0A8J4B430_9CHLO|nr:hypothetical protein Vafri_7065 [Volvox africanus]
MGPLFSIRFAKPRTKADLWQWPSLLVGPSIWLMLFLLSSYAYAKDANYSVEVCPKALWKKAIFLKDPSSPEVFGNVTKWKQEQAKTYVTGTVLPQVLANIVFVGLAVITLIIFLLWRLFRRCCMCCCMRQSCEEKRSQADPKKVLSGCGYWFQKIILLIVALAAFAMLLAGIITAPKELFGKVWGPVNRMTGYLNETTTDMDLLVHGLSDINPVLNSLAVIVQDIDVPQIRSKLQAVGTTLDSSDANPDNVANALAALNISMSSVQSKIAAVRPQLGSNGIPKDLTTLQTGLPGLSNVVASCNNYSTKLTTLNSEFQTLSNEAGPSYDTTSLNAAMTDVDVGVWSGDLGAMVDSLGIWRSFRAGNTLGNLANSVSDLSNAMDTLKDPSISGANTALKSFDAAWTNVSADLGALLGRIDYVQANVSKLDAASNAAVEKLRSVYRSISSLASLQPSPTGLATSLDTLAGALSLGSAAALVADLNSAQTEINAVPLATLDAARTALGDLKSSLDSLSPKFAATKSAIDTYTSSQTQVNFDAMKNSAVSSGNTWDLSQAAKGKADTAATDTSVLQVQTAAAQGNVGSLATTIKSGASSVDSQAATSNTAITSQPPLGPYLGHTTSVKSVYATMGSPKSKELTGISNILSTVDNVLVSTPNNVKSQISSVQKSFGSGVDQLRTKVIVKADDVEEKNDKRVKDLDLARYRATCVLLAVAALVVVLLLVFVVINCPWGIGFAIFFLLVVAGLLFVLAVLFATVLVVAQDGCYHSEHIVLQALGNGSSITPLINYYFFGSNATTVKSVLKSAKLVDIDQVEQKVVDLADGIISNFTATYTPRPRLADVLTGIKSFINTTITQIDGILEEADVDEVRPIYVEVKSYPCCEVTDYSFKLWVVLTFGGWLMYMSATLAIAFLGRLDQLPQSGCCGCKPLRGKALNNQVQPVTEEGEDGVAKAIVVAPAPQNMAQPAEGAAPPPYAAFPPPATYPPPVAYYPPQQQPYAAYPPQRADNP